MDRTIELSHPHLKNMEIAYGIRTKIGNASGKKGQTCIRSKPHDISLRNKKGYLKF